MKASAWTIAAVLLALSVTACAAELFDQETLQFVGGLDHEAISRLPVAYRGRTAVLDTLARDSLRQITGSDKIDGLPPAVAYLEIFFNSGAYLTRPVICVRERSMRQAVADALTSMAAQDFTKTHRIPPASLLDREGAATLLISGRAETLEIELAAAAPFLHQLTTELSRRSEFRLPLDRLSARMVAFIGAGAGDPNVPGQWHLAGSDSAAKLAELRHHWRRRNVEEVRALCRELYGGWGFVLVARDEGITTSGKAPYYRGDLELFYNRFSRSPAVLIGFAASLALMIVAVAASSRWARHAGLAVFSLATLGLFVGFVIRWILSGRAWYLPPIMNQYESVMGSVLLAALVAILLELLRKRHYFAIAAGTYAAVALLACLMFPREMSAGISATHGILNSPIMAAHVAAIIVGHALAGMTFVISLAYLAVAAGRAITGRQITSSGIDLSGPAGAGALAAIDRCNLIVAQLACWAIVAGTMLGAYWADFAWGRWWGWDPKETWALMTALVYVAVIHLRFVTPRRNRGLATAIGCILGCGVMVFNWTVVNYLLAGKHSYA